MNLALEFVALGIGLLLFGAVIGVLIALSSTSGTTKKTLPRLIGMIGSGGGILLVFGSEFAVGVSLGAISLGIIIGLATGLKVRDEEMGRVLPVWPLAAILFGPHVLFTALYGRSPFNDTALAAMWLLIPVMAGFYLSISTVDAEE